MNILKIFNTVRGEKMMKIDRFVIKKQKKGGYYYIYDRENEQEVCRITLSNEKGGQMLADKVMVAVNDFFNENEAEDSVIV